MSLTPEVHALLYTATCQEFLSPVLHRLHRRYGAKVQLSSTVIQPVATMAAYDIGAIHGMRVFRDPSYLFESFFPRGEGRRLLLLVADFDHPAHSLGSGAVRQGRLAGVKSLSIQHGAVAYRKGTQRPYLFNFTSDVMCVWGDWFFDLFCQENDASRLCVSGNPRLDSLPVDRGTARSRISDFWNLDSDTRRALLAISSHDCVGDPAGPNPPTQDEIVAFISGIYTALVDSGVSDILVRPHPSDLFWRAIGPYLRAAEGLECRVVFSNYFSHAQPTLLDVLGGVDLTVSQGSSVAFYSAVCGTPVVSIERDGGEAETPYFDQKVYFRAAAANTEAVSAAVSRVVPTIPAPEAVAHDSSTFADKYLHLGHATDNIAELIGDMLDLD